MLVRTPRIGYVEAWEVQRRLAARRAAGEVPDVVWLLEHDPVYTYGRHGTRDDLHIGDDALAALGGTCVATDRGGQMTWHGPGQTTGYVIADLRRVGGVRRFVDALVAAMADALRLWPADMLLVSTHPEPHSGWLRKGILDKARRFGLPVRHVMATEVPEGAATAS